MKSFKISEKIKEAWPLFKDNLAIFFLIFAMMFVVQAASGKDSIVLSIIMTVLYVLVSYIIIRFLLSLVEKKEFSPFTKGGLPTWRQLWRFVKTYVLFIFVTMGGFIIFFVPGFFILYKTMMFTPLIISIFAASFICLIVGTYLSVRLMFSVFISVDKGWGARKSINESWKITRGHFWKIFWKSFLIKLFMVVGFLALFVGSLITYPLGMILFVMFYKHFEKGEKKEEVVEDNTEVIKEAELLRE